MTVWYVLVRVVLLLLGSCSIPARAHACAASALNLAPVSSLSVVQQSYCTYSGLALCPVTFQVPSMSPACPSPFISCPPCCIRSHTRAFRSQERPDPSNALTRSHPVLLLHYCRYAQGTAASSSCSEWGTHTRGASSVTCRSLRTSTAGRCVWPRVTMYGTCLTWFDLVWCGHHMGVHCVHRSERMWRMRMRAPHTSAHCASCSH